jgi:hypothetical protein
VFQLYSALGLSDTYIAVALAHTLFNVPLAVWILEGFISSVPREIDETAFGTEKPGGSAGQHYGAHRPLGSAGRECGPKLNEKRDPQYWYNQPGAPKPKLDNEKPPGKTMPYDQIMKEMLDGKLPL